MIYFLVERYTPSQRAVDLAAALRRLTDLAVPGATHLCTLHIPGEDTCLSLFAADRAEAVTEANRLAEFTFTRIIRVDPIGPSNT